MDVARMEQKSDEEIQNGLTGTVRRPGHNRRAHAIESKREGRVQVTRKNCAQKLEAGRSVMGVEGLPKTDCPLDPEPGLGGIFSVGLFRGKSSLIWERIPDS